MYNKIFTANIHIFFHLDVLESGLFAIKRAIATYFC